MTKIMTRLEKLSDFQKRNHEISSRMMLLQAESQALENEFRTWMREEFQFPEDRQVHLIDIMKIALESSHEPVIITG